MKRGSQAVSVTRNTDIDLTPPKARVHPRVLNVERGNYRLEIHEDLSGDLCIGAWEGRKVAPISLFWIEATPGNFDELLELLSIARDKARDLGMPAKYR